MTDEQRAKRAEHCRAIAAHGGRTTAERYGAHHMRAIGKAGWQQCLTNHDVGYCRGILTAKGWKGRKPTQLSFDLAFGRLLATH